MSWVDQLRHGYVYESRLAFAQYELVVHRHPGYHADQWLYSCERLGVRNFEVGKRGASLAEAQRLAVEALRHRLKTASQELRRATNGGDE